MCMIRNWLSELLLQNKSPESTNVQKSKLLLQTTNDLFAAQQFLQPYPWNSQLESEICTLQRAHEHSSGAPESLYTGQRGSRHKFREGHTSHLQDTDNLEKLKPTVEINPPHVLDQTSSLAIWARWARSRLQIQFWIIGTNCFNCNS